LFQDDGLPGQSPAMTMPVSIKSDITPAETHLVRRHGRIYSGHPCLGDAVAEKAWMAGTSPAMTR
jgi:hypothetical protein